MEGWGGRGEAAERLERGGQEEGELEEQEQRGAGSSADLLWAVPLLEHSTDEHAACRPEHGLDRHCSNRGPFAGRGVGWALVHRARSNGRPGRRSDVMR